MPNELKPFIHILSKMYIDNGYLHYPLWKNPQTEIDIKYILDYYKKYIITKKQEVL